MIAEADTIHRVDTPEEILALFENAAEADAEAQLPGGLDARHNARFWWMAVADGRAIVLASEGGACIFGLLHLDPNNGDLVCTEGHWFVPRAHRRGQGLELLRALESAAKDAGAVRLNLGLRHSPKAARMGRMYARLGYAPTEHLFTKDV